MTNISIEKYDVIGLMSGTSLDGLDIAFCRFVVDKNRWKFSILNAETIPYSDEWLKKLNAADSLSGFDFQQLHNDYGLYLGQCVANFVTKNTIKPDLVSSHGHTVFHQPDKKITVQIGAGAAIASVCKISVANDFRTLDVLLGGQGAPLVPIGDKLLFNEFDYCLNLGGFANVSYEYNNKRIAYDICPANIVLNHYVSQLNKKYDDKGKIAESGKINTKLLTELNQLAFYHLPANQPKSLGKEWILKNLLPLIDSYPISIEDILRTFCEHIAIQISSVIKTEKSSKMLITGGGAYNTFLIDLIRNKCSSEIVLPEPQIIEFKEALIFALLGVLRLKNEINCLRSVTGAAEDSCGGSLYTI